ncbi:hypothetical protein HDV03_003273 [Kappamyces sp. JEL0829]|nr:hypothetical protein HDV03_003273 [Kappamyces sp. JEL0829]
MRELLLCAVLPLVSSLDPATFTAYRRPVGHVGLFLLSEARLSDKYGIALKAAGATFAANLSNSMNLLYSANISVGSNQQFWCQLDTGSSDFCSAGDASCDATLLNTADPSIQPLQSNLGAPVNFSITYGTGLQFIQGIGSVQGMVWKGPVALAGLQATIPFGASTHESGNQGIDGVLGLAGDAISSISQAAGTSASFFDALQFQGSSNRFGFYLNNLDDANSAEVTFGGVNAARFTGDIVYLPVNMDIRAPLVNNSLTWWVFSLADSTVAVGGSRSLPARPIGSGNVANGIADTGTSLITLGSTVATAINAAIGATYVSKYGWFKIGCGSALTGPDIVFTLGGMPFAIPPAIYVINVGTDSTGAAYCISGITSGADGSSTSSSLAIFGDTFLRTVYSIYDKSTSPPRVGFAKAVHAGSTTQSSGSAFGSRGKKAPAYMRFSILMCLFSLALS